jgi:hypothetical protein
MQARKVSGEPSLEGPISRQEWPWYCDLVVALTGTNASVNQGRVFVMTCAAPRIWQLQAGVKVEYKMRFGRM